MQPQFIKIPDSQLASFLIRDMIVPYFNNPYHFHPELELTYISRGTGTRYIGDHIESFSDGDLILVGSDLPHLWKNDKIYYEGNPYLKSRAIVIQFRENFLGDQLLELPEMKNINKMLLNSRQGFKILGKTKEKVATLMQAMVDRTGTENIINLLLLLNIIAESKDIIILSSRAFSVDSTQVGLKRINDVFAYIFENFSKEISLKKISDIAFMSPTAFCRYFKAHTKKTFSSFILETRINNSCKLIMNENKSLSDIAFESGFNNLSYFTKTFKKIMGMTPTEYRKKIGY